MSDFWVGLEEDGCRSECTRADVYAGDRMRRTSNSGRSVASPEFCGSIFVPRSRRKNSAEKRAFKEIPMTQRIRTKPEMCFPLLAALLIVVAGSIHSPAYGQN